jgi:hypothetical protein
MTRLRKMMLEELQRRNYSQDTTRHYIRTVEEFARRFNCPPDRLGPRHIREYQAELFQKRKLSPGAVTNRLAALRFFYTKTLKKAWSVAETPYPKKQRRIPTILSQEEVARLIGGPAYVLQYLGRYTHRVAISNHRLLSFADGKVTFRWRDSAHHNEQKLMTLPIDEFLRRFLLHLLPKGFVRIRHFGFLANRRRATLLPLCFQLLGATQQPQAQQDLPSACDSHDLWRCPKCGGPMVVVERLTAAEIQLRSPPPFTAAA